MLTLAVYPKIMWYGSQVAEAIQHYGPEYGFTSQEVTFDFATLRKNREAYIERSRASYGNTFNNNGVEVIQGFARFVDNQTVEVNGELIRAKHIVIATGAKPVVPAIPGSELGIVSDDVFAWEELPSSVAVIGAGYIAVEMAGLLHGLGVQTDLFVRGNRPLRSFDTYIVDALMEEMQRTNLPLHTEKTPVSLEKLMMDKSRLTLLTVVTILLRRSFGQLDVNQILTNSTWKQLVFNLLLQDIFLSMNTKKQLYQASMPSVM